MTPVGFHIVPVSGGVAPLGRWGSLVVEGAASAVLRLTQSEDVELPEAVAADITTPSVRLLNDDVGRFLFLPYAAELVVAYDLASGEFAIPPMEVPRDADRGMRAAGVRLLPGRGALYITETLLALFEEDASLVWREEGDYAAWDVEGVVNDEVRLVAGDWSGRAAPKQVTRGRSSPGRRHR